MSTFKNWLNTTKKDLETKLRSLRIKILWKLLLQAVR